MTIHTRLAAVSRFAYSKFSTYNFSLGIKGAVCNI